MGKILRGIKCVCDDSGNANRYHEECFLSDNTTVEEDNERDLYENADDPFDVPINSQDDFDMGILSGNKNKILMGK